MMGREKKTPRQQQQQQKSENKNGINEANEWRERVCITHIHAIHKMNRWMYIDVWYFFPLLSCVLYVYSLHLVRNNPLYLIQFIYFRVHRVSVNMNEINQWEELTLDMFYFWAFAWLSSDLCVHVCVCWKGNKKNKSYNKHHHYPKMNKYVKSLLRQEIDYCLTRTHCHQDAAEVNEEEANFICGWNGKFTLAIYILVVCWVFFLSESLWCTTRMSIIALMRFHSFWTNM